MAREIVGPVASHSHRAQIEGANKPPAKNNSPAVSAGKPRASRLWGTELAEGEGYTSAGVWYLRLDKIGILADEREIGGCRPQPEPKIEDMKLPPDGNIVTDCPFCHGGELWVSRADRKSSWCCNDCGRHGLAPQRPIPN